jgi:hypothetical protein
MSVLFEINNFILGLVVLLLTYTPKNTFKHCLRPPSTIDVAFEMPLSFSPRHFSYSSLDL